MKTAVSQKLKEVSLGCLKSTVDYALFLVMHGAGMVLSGSRSVAGMESAAEWAEGVNVDSLRRAFRQLREKGYIKRDMTPTRAGQKRLHALFPEPRMYPARWDNTWYLVSFDIPERIAYKRRLLREALRALGFAKLHESLWISPFKVLGDVRAYAKTQRLDWYIMLAISKEVGTERSQALAARLFNLEELHQGYKTLLREGESVAHDQKMLLGLVCQYYALLARDPFLPRPLLGEEWCGDKAHARFKKIFQTWRAK